MKPKYRIEIIKPVSELKLQKLYKILNRDHASKNLKITNIRNTFNCICTSCRSERFDYPARRVVYQLPDIQKIETYCLKCFEKAGYKDTTTANKPKPKRSKVKK